MSEKLIILNDFRWVPLIQEYLKVHSTDIGYTSKAYLAKYIIGDLVINAALKPIHIYLHGMFLTPVCITHLFYWLIWVTVGSAAYLTLTVNNAEITEGLSDTKCKQLVSKGLQGKWIDVKQ